MRVLIVEDEILVAMYLEELVVSCGHKVCALSASAAEAMESAAAHAPDIALMDIRLARGTSGIDAARAIYSRCGVRCIFLSGNLDDATRRELEACEPIDFIGKPVLPVLLSRALEKAEQELTGRSK
jgi:DNA-binding NarL/FixJ family response regulator